jgi:hypothetical protein
MNPTGRFFQICPTLQTLPHRITTASALAPTICVEFPSTTDAGLQNWLDDFYTAKPADFFKRGIENLSERWEAVVINGGEYIID